MCVTALGNNLSQAKTRAYDVVSKIHWDSVQYRTDIGWRAMKNIKSAKYSNFVNIAGEEIKNTSIKLAVEAVKKVISSSVDKSKLDNLFDKNLEDSKIQLKKIKS